VPEPRGSALSNVISRREARLLFWLVLIALVTVVANLSSDVVTALSGPAIILFVAWLLAYVLEPAVTWLARHMPFKSRGLAVATTYLVTAVVAFAVLLGATIALLNAAIAFVNELPAIVARTREAMQPVLEFFGLTPTGEFDLSASVANFVATNGQAIADAAKAATANIVTVVAGLFTAVIISVGLAAGQVSLLGWTRRFLPERTYRDIAELERAIAVSFGGFVRGRGLIGVIYGIVILLAAFWLGIPFAPLIAVVAGLIVFIPWIGPLIGWAVLPAFAVVLAPEVVVPAVVVSLIASIAIQLVVTQLVMGAAVNMSPVAVFSVVIIGTALAGIMGAIFAIPTAAAILAITDYLRERDVLLRSEGYVAPDAVPPPPDAAPPAPPPATTGTAG
jgi:predicted PurR-regulated permease PerM